MSRKTVDVIIPAYNAEKFIERALKSVVSQTYLPEKIIIVDDGSTDKAVDIIENFKKNSKVKIDLYKQENSGPNAARNAGLKHSDSEFVAFLDADDIWHKNKINKQMERFCNNTEKLGAVYVEHEMVEENGKVVSRKVKFPLFSGNIYDVLLKRNIIIGSCSSVLIKRECFERAGFFDETLSGSEDWDMWLRISKLYDFDYVPEALVFITDRVESNNKNYEKMLENRIRFLNKWIDEIKKDNTLVEFHRNKIIMLAIRCKTKNLSFKVIENIQKFLSVETSKVLFENDRIKLLRCFPSAIFNYLRERMF